MTHVAFQTGATHVPVLGRIWGRFDLAVAVFFALSGFLLWRSHAGGGAGDGPRPVNRPVLDLAGDAHPARVLGRRGGGVDVPAARPTRVTARGWRISVCVQVFVPLTLTDGLTQMWSLSVEVAFYLVLPLLAFALVRLRGPAARLRVPAISR